MSNTVDPDQTAPIGAIGAVCSGSMLFASILNSSVMLGNYLQQTTFSDAFFLLALYVLTLCRNLGPNKHGLVTYIQINVYIGNTLSLLNGG